MFLNASQKVFWSKINKDHVARLIKSGQMTESGLRAIKVAKANGSWNSLNKSDSLTYPDELVDAFLKNKKASHNFELFSPSVRRMSLQWIYDAKKPNTKLDRINKVVTAAEDNIKLR